MGFWKGFKEGFSAIMEEVGNLKKVGEFIGVLAGGVVIVAAVVGVGVGLVWILRLF